MRTATSWFRPATAYPAFRRHHLNAVTNHDLTDRITVGAGMVAVSRQFARGNDNNRHQPDGVNFLGPGEIGGHALLNLNLDYKLDRGLRSSRSSPTSSTGVTPPPARCSRTSSPAATWRRRAPRSRDVLCKRARRARFGSGFSSSRCCPVPGDAMSRD